MSPCSDSHDDDDGRTCVSGRRNRIGGQSRSPRATVVVRPCRISNLAWTGVKIFRSVLVHVVGLPRILRTPQADHSQGSSRTSITFCRHTRYLPTGIYPPG